MGTRNQAWQKTYEMHVSPPKAMPWDEYERRVTADWSALLASEKGGDERAVHEFLVKHPCMIPGAFSVTGPSGHGPFPMAVLSESPLSAVGMKIPDFIWLASDSLNFTPVFVEIESPRKRWFTKQGHPTSDLTQAMSQIAQWRDWLNSHVNVGAFFDSFDIPNELRRKRNFRAEFVLIYGRREEFADKPELTRLRAQLEKHGQVVMTFDRLLPARDCRHYVCDDEKERPLPHLVGAGDDGAWARPDRAADGDFRDC